MHLAKLLVGILFALAGIWLIILSPSLICFGEGCAQEPAQIVFLSGIVLIVIGLDFVIGAMRPKMQKNAKKMRRR